MKLNVCANCGGEEAIHQYETLRCLKGCREAPVGRPDVWQNTFWDDGKTEDDIETLKVEIKSLKIMIDELTKNLSILEEDFCRHENNVRMHND